jgi:hypothetical protein
MDWILGVRDALQAAPHAYAADLSWRIYQTPGPEVFWPEPGYEPLVSAGSPSLNEPGISPYPVYLTPMNRGSEAVAYLQAILDHWDDDGWTHMVFMHAHWHSHHTHLMHDWQLLQLAARPLPASLSYASLQCVQNPPGWNRWFLQDMARNDPNYKAQHAPHIVQAWTEYFGAAGLGELPETLVAPSNAEFIASREAIRARGQAFYEGALTWLQTTDLLSLYIGVAMVRPAYGVAQGTQVGWRLTRA